MVNNTSNLERIAYISNLNSQPDQKTLSLRPRGRDYDRNDIEGFGDLFK